MDTALRNIERAARFSPGDMELQERLLNAQARAGDPVALLQVTLREAVQSDSAAAKARVRAYCSDPAFGLAYDDPLWGRMCYVPDHVSVLGSAQDDTQAFADEKPQMAVGVPAFWIAREPARPEQWQAAGGGMNRVQASPHGYLTNVSWEEVNAVLGRQAPPGASYRVGRGGSWYGEAGGCRAANRGRGEPTLAGRLLGFRPARSVSVCGASYRVNRGGCWYIEARFCRAAYRYRHEPTFALALALWGLGFRPARAVDDDSYRLPTEDEWEAAARGPWGLIYPWGNNWRPEVKQRLSQAGESWCGVRAMSGVVWQWCQDEYTPQRHPRVEAVQERGP